MFPPVLAILSNIHANLEALDAVLDDARREGAGEVYCLGNTIGYGANPWECVIQSMTWPQVLMGNFERALLGLIAREPDPMPWSATIAVRSVEWTYEVWRRHHRSAELKLFLASLEAEAFEGTVAYVHGSLRNPLYESVFPEDVYNLRKLQRVADRLSWLCFSGHTGIAGLHIEVSDGAWEWSSPADCNHAYRMGNRRVICNVGSVGQPRDGDWRAGYVLFDGQQIRFRRVEYDIDGTVAKILNNPSLDPFSASRIREGR